MVFDGAEHMKYADGTFTVIPKNLSHTTLSSGEGVNYWEFIYIDVDKFLSDEYRSDPIFARELIVRIEKRAYVLNSDENEMLADSIKAIMEEKRVPLEFGREIERCLVLKLLLEIARLNPIEIEKDDHPQKRKKLLLKSLDYINVHYREPIKIQTLAELCHLSETHYRRLFEDSVQMMPVAYINFVRIQKACEYLHNTNDSMENVALKVGFISQSTFNRNFLRFVGVSPHKWKSSEDNYRMKLLNYKITALKGW